MKKILLCALIVCIQQLRARCDEIDELTLASGDQNLYTTHSETTRPIHVPVFEREAINVPHPVPYAVPQYIKIAIPQPYPEYTKIQHPIQFPVYKVIPEIIEKPSPYTVEKPFPIEVEKPFPVEVVKKFEVPIPRPYPVHMIYYKHISEDEPAPKVVARPSKQQIQQHLQHLQQLKLRQLQQQQQKLYAQQHQFKSRILIGKINPKKSDDDNDDKHRKKPKRSTKVTQRQRVVRKTKSQVRS